MSSPNLPQLLAKGEPVLLDLSGQPLGLVCLAAKLNAKLLNKLLTVAHSMPYLLLGRKDFNRLELPLVGYSHLGWIMGETIEAAQGIGSGISVADRVKTIITAISPQSSADDIACPGHVQTALLDGSAGEPAARLVDAMKPNADATALLWMPALDENGATTESHWFRKQVKGLKYYSDY